MSRYSANELRRVLARYTPTQVDDRALQEGAVALVLVPAGSLNVLFIRRAERIDDPWSGQMALPGGRRDASDADLLATAVRETREETGIDLAPSNLIGTLDDLAPRTPMLPPIMVRPFVFLLDERPAVTSSREVASHLWISVDDLNASTATSRVSARGQEISVPSYVVGGQIIWGMTYRIVSNLFDLAK